MTVPEVRDWFSERLDFGEYGEILSPCAVPGVGIGTGSIFHISLQYSCIVLSLLNLPDLASPIIAIFVQSC
jgi:hypothetical protein